MALKPDKDHIGTLTLILTLFLLLQIGSANAATITVPGNYTTIQAAIDAANPGDTINVDPGTYNENIDINKTINLIGSGADITIINASNPNDHVIEITANWANVSGFSVTGATSSFQAGIHLKFVDNILISNITASNNSNGIYTLYSNNNKIINCVAHSNLGRGIWIYRSNDNYITKNNVSHNLYKGIDLQQSDSNNISQNTVKSNKDQGVMIHLSDNNILLNNTVSSNIGEGIELWTSKNNRVEQNQLMNNSDGITLITDSNNNILKNNNIGLNNQYGILLHEYSNGNNITNNTISSNDYGIYLWQSSSNNNITENLASNNNYGIYLSLSSNNIIYYNNFINNTNQSYDNGNNSWDSGYPGGGNYWSDFDEFSEGCFDSNIDNVCDSPYNISGGNNSDNYPVKSLNGWEKINPNIKLLIPAFDLRDVLDSAIQIPSSNIKLGLRSENISSNSSTFVIIERGGNLSGEDSIYDFHVEPNLAVGQTLNIIGNVTLKVLFIDSGPNSYVKLEIRSNGTPYLFSDSKTLIEANPPKKSWLPIDGTDYKIGMTHYNQNFNRSIFLLIENDTVRNHFPKEKLSVGSDIEILGNYTLVVSDLGPEHITLNLTRFGTPYYSGGDEITLASTQNGFEYAVSIPTNQDIKLFLKNLSWSSSQIEGTFGVVENGVITRFEIRSNTTAPYLRVGSDLKLLDSPATIVKGIGPYYVTIKFSPLFSAPSINWDPPTPEEDATIKEEYVYLNTTIMASNDTAAFFDWNRSLLGYWSMDHFNASGAHDNSSYGHFGSFQGGLGTSDIVNGKFGKALEFDGADDHVDMGADILAGSNDTTPFSVSLWIKPSKVNYTIYGTLVDGRYYGDVMIGWWGWLILIGDPEPGNITLLLNKAQVAGKRATSTTVAETGNWYHVAVSYNGSVGKLFINGVLEDAVTAPTGTKSTRQGISLGRTNRHPSITEYKGLMDEAILFDRALSEREIKAVYNNGLHRLEHNFTDLNDGTYEYAAYAIDSAGKLNISSPRSVKIDTTNLLNNGDFSDGFNHWTFNDTSLQAGGPFAYSEAVVENGVDLIKAHYAYGIGELSQNLEPVIVDTLEADYGLNGTCSNQKIDLKFNGEIQLSFITWDYGWYDPNGPRTQKGMYLTNQNGIISYWNGANYTSGTIKFEFNDSNISLYHNKTLLDILALPSLVIDEVTLGVSHSCYDGRNHMTASYDNILLTGHNDKGTPSIKWVRPTPTNGAKLNESHVYLNATVNDDSATSAFYDWNRSLLGYWSMDHFNASGVHDNSSYGHFGSFQGGLGTSDIVNGKFGKALEFDGIDDEVKTSIGGVNLEDSPSASFSAWLYPHGEPILSGNQRSIFEDNSIRVTQAGDSGKSDISFWVATKTGTYHRDKTVNALELANKWTHLAGTWDGADIRIYINGNLVSDHSDGNQGSGNINDPNTDPTSIASLIDERYDGLIDELAIFSRVLSPEEINASYNNGLYRLEHNFTDLNDGTYEYAAYAIDSAGNLNITEYRSVKVDSYLTPVGSTYLVYDDDKEFDIIVKKDRDVSSGTWLYHDEHPWSDFLHLDVMPSISGSNVQFRYFIDDIDDDSFTVAPGSSYQGDDLVASLANISSWPGRWLITGNLASYSNNFGIKQDQANNSGGYGVWFDANGDGDVDDSADYPIYNDLYIEDLSSEEIKIRPSMRIGNLSFLERKFFNLKGQDYFVLGFRADINQVTLGPISEKSLLNTQTTQDCLDSALLIPGTDMKICLRDLTSSPSGTFAVIEGGVIIAYIHRDNTNTPLFQIGTDLELLTDFRIIPTFIDSHNQYIKIAIGKKTDDFKINHGDTNVLGFSRAVVDDNSNGWMDEFRLEDDPIGVARKGDQVQLANTFTYANLDDNGFFDLENRRIKSATSGSKLRSTQSPWSDFLSKDASVFSLNAKVRFSYHLDDIDQNQSTVYGGGSEGDDVENAATSTSWIGKWLVTGLSDLYNNNSINLSRIFEIGENQINNSDSYGVWYDANGDGDIHSYMDYPIYNDFYIKEQTPGHLIVKPAMRIGNLSFLNKKVFELIGQRYLISDFNSSSNRISLIPVLEVSLTSANSTQQLVQNLTVPIPGTDISLGAKNLTDSGNFISTQFAILRGGVVKSYYFRDNVSHPKLALGIDLEILEDFFIAPTKIDPKNGVLDLAIGNKSHHIDITDHDTNVLGYPHARVNVDSDGWMDEFRLEGNEIKIIKDSISPLPIPTLPPFSSPQILVTPHVVNLSLFQSENRTFNLTIGNDGFSLLQWNITLLSGQSGCCTASSTDFGSSSRTTVDKPEIKRALIQDYVPGEVLVRYKKKTKIQDRSGVYSSTGVKVLRKFDKIGFELLEFDPDRDINQVKKDLLASGMVESVEPNYIVKALEIPNDPLFNNLWGLHNTGQTGGKIDADIDAPEAWGISTGKRDVVVAVIDTGVDYTHEDLKDNIWTNLGEIPDNGVDDDGNGFVDDYHGWDFAYDDNDPMDIQSHGTHVSGTIGGVGNNGIGVAGVSWRVRILPIKFLGDNGFGTNADAIDSINYAVMMGADIMSNSWGGGGYSSALKAAIESANEAGVLFVAAAGNNALNNDLYPHYPSSYDVPNVLAVAATDHNDNLAGFSNYGNVSVDIGAPGVNTVSSTPGNKYNSKSGTSMATPHVSGAAALLKANNPFLSHLEIKETLIGSADILPSLIGKSVSGGRLNIFNALLLTPPSFLQAQPIKGSISTGSNANVSLIFNASGLNNGTYHASVRIESNDPRQGDLVVPVNLNVIDKTPPEITIHSPSNQTYGQSSVSLIYYVDEDTSWVAYNLDETGNRTINGNTILTNISNGVHKLTVHATDYGGNNNSRTVWFSVKAPDIKVSPTGFGFALLQNQLGSTNLFIENKGPGVLIFNVTDESSYYPGKTIFSLDNPKTLLNPTNSDASIGYDQAPQLTPDTGYIDLELHNLSGIRIGYDLTHNERNTTALNLIRNDLSTRGALVNYITTGPFNRSLLGDYDILWVDEDYTGLKKWTDPEIDALEDWIRNSGSLIIHGDQPGSAINLSTIFGVQYRGISGIPGSTTNITPHQITKDVESIYVSAPLDTLEATTPGYAIVFDSAGYNTISVSEFGKGRVVVLADDYLWDSILVQGDNRMLANQAFDWVSHGGVPDWLSESPLNGTVPSGGNINISILVNSTALNNGSYTRNLIVESNDQRQTPFKIPVNLNVLDITPPQITIISPTNLTYNQSTISLEYTINEEPAWVAYNLDGGLNKTIPRTMTLSNLADGYHNLTIFATDLGGNNDSETVWFRIETPDVWVRPVGMNVTLPPDRIADRELIVGNNGSGLLKINMSFWTGSEYDMETNVVGWEHYKPNGTKVPDNWQLSSNRYHSFNHSWHSGIEVLGSGDTALESPELDLRNVKNASFSFYHWYYFDGSSGFYPDGGIIEIKNSTGNWTQLTPLGGYDAFITKGYLNPLEGRPAFTYIGGPSGWVREEVDLSAYVGDIVKIRFHVGWDYGSYSLKEGWYIDDVTLTSHSWLEAAVAEHELPKNTSVSSRVVFNTSGVELRDYSGRILIESNDLDETPLIIPVHLSISNDSTPPSILTHSPLNRTYHTSNILLNASANEHIDTWWYSLNGMSNISFKPPFILSNLTEGLHNITIFANDSVGNIGHFSEHVINKEWSKSFDEINHSTGVSIAFDSENNSIIAGSIYNGYNNDYYIAKYNQKGNLIWYRVYDGGDWDEAVDIDVDSQNKIIVTGRSYLGGDRDYFTIKYDPDGRQLWNRTFDISEWDYATALDIDSLDNIVISGYAYHAGNNDYSLVKYYSNGSIIWNKTIDKGNNDYAYGISVDSEDNIIITGYSQIESGYDFNIVKMDSDGGIIWNRREDINTWDSDVAVDSNDNMIVSAYSRIEGDDDYLTIKYSRNGSHIWNRTFDSGSWDWASGITVDSSDNIILTGHKDYLDYLTLKYDPDGNILWNKTFDSGSYDYPEDVKTGPNDSIFITGSGGTIVYDESGEFMDLIDFDTNSTFHGSAHASDEEGNSIVSGSIFNGKNFNLKIVKYHPSGSMIWENEYPGINRGNVSSIIIDKSKNIFIIAWTINNSSPDLLLLKFDEEGSLLWNKTYATFPFLSNSIGKLDQNENIIVSGDHFNGTNQHFYTSKFNSNGNLLWTNKIEDGISRTMSNFEVDSKNNVIVTYGINSHITTKYAPDGTVLWNRTFNPLGWSRIIGLAIDSKDNIIVSGSGNYLVRYSPNGTKSWNITYDGGYCYDATCVAVDSEDNIIITGTTRMSNNDYYTIKFSSNGTQIWNRTFDSGYNDYAQSVLVDSLGNVIVGGYDDRNNWIVVMYDSSGTRLWTTEESAMSWHSLLLQINALDDIFLMGSNKNRYTIFKYSNRHQEAIFFTIDLGKKETGIGVNSTTVFPSKGLNLTFNNVTLPGNTTVTKSESNPGGGLPQNFKVAGNFYNISTTANFSGNITICIYDIDIKPGYKLFHWSGSGWEDITSVVNATADYVCGVTSSLSPFGVFYYQAPSSGGGGGGGGGSGGGGGGGAGGTGGGLVSTIFEGRGVLTEDDLIEIMQYLGHDYGPKYAFNRLMAPMASLYAAKGEVVISMDLASKLTEVISLSGLGLEIKEYGDIYKENADYILHNHPGGDTLIVARGDLEVDSLLATPLSELTGGGILLVPPDNIPEPTMKVLKRREFNPYRTIYIIGGEDAVSKEVEDVLTTYGREIKRVSGATRYETSVEVAKEVILKGGSRMPITTSGERPVYYSATLATKYRSPILLLNEPPMQNSTFKNHDIVNGKIKIMSLATWQTISEKNPRYSFNVSLDQNEINDAWMYISVIGYDSAAEKWKVKLNGHTLAYNIHSEPVVKNERSQLIRFDLGKYVKPGVNEILIEGTSFNIDDQYYITGATFIMITDSDEAVEYWIQEGVESYLDLGSNDNYKRPMSIYGTFLDEDQPGPYIMQWNGQSIELEKVQPAKLKETVLFTTPVQGVLPQSAHEQNIITGDVPDLTIIYQQHPRVEDGKEDTPVLEDVHQKYVEDYLENQKFEQVGLVYYE